MRHNSQVKFSTIPVGVDALMKAVEIIYQELSGKLSEDKPRCFRFMVPSPSVFDVRREFLIGGAPFLVEGFGWRIGP